MVARSRWIAVGTRPPSWLTHRAHGLAGLNAVLRPDRTDGADDLLNQPEVPEGVGILRPAVGAGPWRDRDRGPVIAAGKPLPERFRDERHHRVQEA